MDFSVQPKRIKLLLGLDLDNAAHPDVLDGASASLGRLVTGFAGLLTVLETQLGLLGPEVPAAARIAAYQDRLRVCAEGAFFSRSFEADGWATAQVLLAWRDELLLAGWSPDATQDAPPRLQTLATIENMAVRPLPPGLPERLAAVHDALLDPVQLPLDIRCIDMAEALPSHWHRLLEKLERCGVTITWNTPLHPSARGLLGSLQRAMAQHASVSSDSSDDDSIRLIKGRSRREVAEALALWLEGLNEERRKGIVVIRNGGCQELDTALQRRGLPRLGVCAPSPWRGALQVLPAMFATRWEPRDPQAMFEFLSLPSSPLPGKVARLFRKALREHFGIGGPLWQKAWQEAIAVLEAIDSFSGSPEAFLDKWLGGVIISENDKCTPKQAASLCEDVALWAGGRAAMEESDLLARASGIAQAAAACFREYGNSSLSRVQVARILDTVMQQGAEDSAAFREASYWRVVERPSQIWGPVETIIWWDFVDQGSSRSMDPWSSEERQWLSLKGWALEEPETRFRRQAQAWRRPLLHATRQAVLVQPESALQEALSPHPLLAEIVYFLGLPEAGLVQLTLEASKVCRSNTPDIMGVVPAMRPATQPPLPVCKDVWLCSPPREWTRDPLSYSSLESLLRCPLAWVLKRHAKIRPGYLMEVPRLEAAKGELAHNAMASLFTLPLPLTPENAEQYVREHLDEWMAQMAGQLLLPGFEQEMHELRENLPRTAKVMVEVVNDAGLRFLGSEVACERAVDDDLVVSGRLDLLFETPDGQPVCWDMKWTKWGRYKHQELMEGNAAQLAVYAWLIEATSAPFPAGGYFLLMEGELLSVPCKGLERHSVHGPLSLQQQWHNLHGSLDARLALLKNEKVTACGLLSEEDQRKGQILFLEPKCAFCDFINLCGITSS